MKTIENLLFGRIGFILCGALLLLIMNFVFHLFNIDQWFITKYNWIYGGSVIIISLIKKF